MTETDDPTVKNTSFQSIVYVMLSGEVIGFIRLNLYLCSSHQKTY